MRVSCVQCSKTTPNTLSLCGNCKDSVYCSKECQTKHWPQHRAICAETTAKSKRKQKEAVPLYERLESFISRVTKMAKSPVSLPDLTNEIEKWASVERELVGIFGELLGHLGASQKETTYVQSEIDKYGQKAAQLHSTIFPNGAALPAGFFAEMGRHATNAEIIVNNLIDKRAGTRDTNIKNHVVGQLNDLDIFTDSAARIFLHANGKFDGFKTETLSFAQKMPMQMPIGISLRGLFRKTERGYEVLQSAGADFASGWLRSFVDCYGSMLGIPEDPSTFEQSRSNKAVARHEEVVDLIEKMTEEHASWSVSAYKTLSAFAEKIETHRTIVWNSEEEVNKYTRSLEMAVAATVTLAIGYKYIVSFQSRADHVNIAQSALKTVIGTNYIDEDAAKAAISELNAKIANITEESNARVFLSNTTTTKLRAQALAMLEHPPTFTQYIGNQFAEYGCPYPDEWKPQVEAQTLISKAAIASGVSNNNNQTVFQQQPENATVVETAPIECDARSLMTYARTVKDEIVAQALVLVNSDASLHRDPNEQVVREEVERYTLAILNATLKFNDTDAPEVIASKLVYGANRTGVLGHLESRIKDKAAADVIALDKQLEKEQKEMREAEEQAKALLLATLTPFKQELLVREAELAAIQNKTRENVRKAGQNVDIASEAIDNPIQRLFSDMRMYLGVGSSLAAFVTFLESTTGGNFTELFNTISTALANLATNDAGFGFMLGQIGTYMGSVSKILLLLQIMLSIILVLAPALQTAATLLIQVIRRFLSAVFGDSVPKAMAACMDGPRWNILSMSARLAYGLIWFLWNIPTGLANGFVGGLNIMGGLGVRWAPIFFSACSMLTIGLALISYGFCSITQGKLCTSGIDLKFAASLAYYFIENAVILQTRWQIIENLPIPYVSDMKAKRPRPCVKVLGKVVTKFYEAYMTHDMFASLCTKGSWLVSFIVRR